uniref:Uncharacterized protein n=1 Tax=Globodera rostochiensis TaxID=31243 RepID=A0A914I4P4_GLORO
MKLSIACVVALSQLFILIPRLHFSVMMKSCAKGRREYSVSNTSHNGQWKDSFQLHICCEGDWCRDGQQLKPITTTEQTVHEEEVSNDKAEEQHHDLMPNDNHRHGADLAFPFKEMTPKYYFGFSFGSAANLSQVTVEKKSHSECQFSSVLKTCRGFGKFWLEWDSDRKRFHPYLFAAQNVSKRSKTDGQNEWPAGANHNYERQTTETNDKRQICRQY